MDNELIELAKQAFGPLSDIVFKETLPQLYRAGVRKLVECFKRRSRARGMEEVRPNQTIIFEAIRSISPFHTDVQSEYLTGILLSSGVSRADESVSLIYLIRQLSSSQLLLHYHIYHALSQHLFQRYAHNGEEYEPHQPVFFGTSSIASSSIAVDLAVLEHHSLIDTWGTGNKIIDESHVFNYASATRSTLGVMLYAAAQNELDGWDAFGQKRYDRLHGIEPLGLSSMTLDHLVSRTLRQSGDQRSK